MGHSIHISSTTPADPGIACTARPSLVLARSRRLAELEARSQEHAANFPSAWLDYGEADPLEYGRWVNPCGHCGETPEIQRAGNVHVACCQCGAEALGARVHWQAVMNWNKSPLAEHPEWRELPFFYLSDLEPAAARTKLIALREHLTLRANLEGMRRVLGFKVGSNYLQRLKAYLAWCSYAQELLNRAEPRTNPTARIQN